MHKQVVIIGGGLAGLSCAQQLKQSGVDFALLTPQLGGRVATSANGRVNYGAYVLPDTSKHILRFAKKGRRLHLFKLHFHQKAKEYNFLLALFKNERELIRLMRLVRRFQKDYFSWQRDCERMSQVEAFTRHPFLLELYRMPAETCIANYRITDIVQTYISEVVYMCTFLPLRALNAFNLMQIAMYIDIPVHEFTLDTAALASSFTRQIINGSVVAVEDGEEVVTIRTKNGTTITADRVVIATPFEVAAKWFAITHDRVAPIVSLFHISGEKKPDWRVGDLELFDSASPIIFMSQQEDGSYLIYTNGPDPVWADYFVSHTVIAKKIWDPAFYIGGHQIVPQTIGTRILLACDMNVIGMEDAWISGVYAARFASHR